MASVMVRISIAAEVLPGRPARDARQDFTYSSRLLKASASKNVSFTGYGLGHIGSEECLVDYPDLLARDKGSFLMPSIS